MRKLIFSKQMGMLALAVLLAFPVGCSKKNNDSTNAARSAGDARELAHPDSDATFRYPLRDDVKSLDPANAYDSVSLTVMPLVMESLYQYAYLKSPIQLEPLLADGMPVISKDGKTVTIKIKKGVLFHDDAAFANGKGREVTAEDFIYGWKRLLHPDLQSSGTWIFEDKVVGYSALKQKISQDKTKTPDQYLAEPFAGFTALDKYTIQIKLEQPYRQLQYVLAMGFTAPVAEEVIKKYGQQGINDHMVGTGPFQQREIVRGSKIILDRNPTFRREEYPKEGDSDAKARGLLADAGKALPLVDHMQFDIVKEDSPLWLQFNKGSLDSSGGIPKDNFNTAVTAQGALSPELLDKGIALHTEDRPVIWYLNFNMKDSLVGKNVNLRRAIVRAVDRNYMIKIFLNDRGVKGGSIIPPGIEGSTGKKTIDGDFNIAEAKEYLKRAGYPGGVNLPPIRLDLRGAQTSTRQQGDYLKKALKEIGVEVNVIANTFPAYLEKEKNGNLQFFIGGWQADYPDPENFLQLLYSKNVAPGPNASNWQNAKFDELYHKISNMKSSKEKDKLIAQAEKIAFDDQVWSMLYYPKNYELYHAWVGNFRPRDLINNSLKYVKVDTEKRRKLLAEKF